MIPSGIRDTLREHSWFAYISFCLFFWGVLITGPDLWAQVWPHWKMALVMIGGSLVAGSTPMGGGTIAFPALVLAFHQTPAMARDFGLAIQSIGMTSALLFIVKRGIPVEKRLLTWSCLGAVVGLAVGTYGLASWVPADWVKLLFATLWITFGGWLVTGTANATSEPRPSTEGTDVAVFGLIIGIVGGAVASLIGVGVEMLVYATLVLRFGWGPKAAVPTAVCTTALVSPVGMVLRFMTAGVHPAVYPTWMACIPIVIFGAPAGAYISTRMPRSVLLKIIGLLVLVQFAATVNQVRPSLEMWIGVLAMAALSGGGLWLLAPGRRSERLEEAPATRSAGFDLRERLGGTVSDRATVADAGFPAARHAAFADLDLPEPTAAPFAAPVVNTPMPAAPPTAPIAPAPPVARPAASIAPLPAARPAAPIAPPPAPPRRSYADDVSPSFAPDPTPQFESPAAPENGNRIGVANLASFYELGVRLHSIGSLASGMSRRDWLIGNAQSTAFLESALDGEHTPLIAARDEAARLLAAVNEVALRTDEPVNAQEARTVQSAYRNFEQAFQKALQNEIVVHVARVGIYDTTLILNRADEMFPADVLQRMSARTRDEWRFAGRCLALHLGTACTFHTIRALESLLPEHGQGAAHPRLVELIDYVREHRPTTSGDLSDPVAANQAYALFNFAHSAIVTLLDARPQASAAASRREWA